MQDILLGRRKCLLGPKIFTNLYIIMYILILDFQLVVRWGWVEEMFTYILDKSCKALSVLLGGVVVGGKKLLLY